MTFTPEELEEMRLADEEIERDFAHGRIKADPLASQFADPERAKKAEYYRNQRNKDREKYNAYQREYRARVKAKYPDRWNEYARNYRAKIKEMYRGGATV
jgi:predicted metal-dependent phosphoesterase TrpH